MPLTLLRRREVVLLLMYSYFPSFGHAVGERMDGFATIAQRFTQTTIPYARG